MALGFSIAFLIADSVISLNTILLALFSSNFNNLNKCQAIASPSRSSSLANHTVSDLSAKSLRFLTTVFLSFDTSYLGLKSPSTFTPKSFEGKSDICPKLEATLKSLPKNFSIVLAFAGDSTITKFFAIFLN